MARKLDAKGVHVDWDLVQRNTEIARTYLIRTRDGRELFKMYKPTEARRIFKEKGWTGQIVSTVK